MIEAGPRSVVEVNAATSHNQLPRVILRPTTESDLPSFFEHQLDPEANRMAAFTAKDPDNRSAFMAHWGKILDDEGITVQTILFDGQIAGHIAYFQQFGKPSISYWIDRGHWGKGVATEALRQFLAQLVTRPLYARAAKDNLGSLRVLEKCGFRICGADKGFSHARGEEVEEYILELA